MLKKLITRLYNKYCAPSHIKSLYLGGIQRDFEIDLTEQLIVERNLAVYNFLQTGYFLQLLNEELREYTDVLFQHCSTEDQRNYVHGAINILLKFEERVHRVGSEPTTTKDFDKYQL